VTERLQAGTLDAKPHREGRSREMPRFAVAGLDEIDEIDDGRCPFRPVRHHFGITSFGVNAMTARADGDRLINEHEEAEPNSSEELYVVVSGHARFELDGELREAPAGTFVHVPAGIKRTAFARDAGTTVLSIGAGAAGKPYEPTGWELFAPLFPLFESGDYEEGADRAQALLAEDPPYGAVYYNTACFESRAGRTEDALAHLRRAVELSPSLAESARADDDLAALREQAGFAEIVGD
jgi:tetratricopeptide (TPR) repeat protein